MLAAAGGGGGGFLLGDWGTTGRIVAQAGIFYLIMVAALRIAGQRALAKMSGYDMIVTVALGSLVANVATSTQITVADGVAAVLTFLVLQGLTSWMQARSKRVHHMVRQRPEVMLWNGRFVRHRLEESSVTEDEVRAAIRRTGLLSLSQVQAVVLENDGEWSVIGRSDVPDLSALEGLALPYDLTPGEDPANWRDDRPDEDNGGDHDGDGRRRSSTRGRHSDRPAGRHVERGADQNAGGTTTSSPL